jgi:hypothetical protein
MTTQELKSLKDLTFKGLEMITKPVQHWLIGFLREEIYEQRSVE